MEELKLKLFQKCNAALKEYLQVEIEAEKSVHRFIAEKRVRYASGKFVALYELIEEAQLEDEYFKWKDEHGEE